MNEANINIDPKAMIAPTVRIHVADDSQLQIAASVQIADNVVIEIAEEGVVDIDQGVSIGPNAVLRGHGDIRIGKRSIIGPGCVLDSSPLVDDKFEFGNATEKAPIQIGERVRIGTNAVIEAGVTIQNDAVIKPNSHVTRNVGANEIIVGSPASITGHRTTASKPRRFLFGFCRWHETAQHFVTIANTLRAANIDTRIYCTPETASRLRYIEPERLIIREDLRDLDGVFDAWSPEAVFIWSGATQIDQQVGAAARDRNIECRYAELGWFPQSKSVHFDTDGTNARSSIRRLNLAHIDIDPRLNDWLAQRRTEMAAPPPDIRNYIFVPLQDIRDVNITLGSPYATMDDFVSALARKFPSESFVVRPHPNFSDVLLAPHANVHVRRDLSIHSWLQHADAVIGINSTALLESLAYGKPTHAVGTGLATGLNALYEFDHVDSLEIHRDIDAERNERIHKLLSELVFKRQVMKKDLHYLSRLETAHGIGDLLRPTSVASATTQLTRTVPAISTNGQGTVHKSAQLPV